MFSLHLPYTLRNAEALFSICPLDAVQVYSPVWSTVTFSTMSVLDSSREFHSFFLWFVAWVQPFMEVWCKRHTSEIQFVCETDHLEHIAIRSTKFILFWLNIKCKQAKPGTCHLCTLTWYRDKLEDSWKQEVKDICKDDRKWDPAPLVSLCVFSGM